MITKIIIITALRTFLGTIITNTNSTVNSKHHDIELAIRHCTRANT
jgi:hypothetical protein